MSGASVVSDPLVDPQVLGSVLGRAMGYTGIDFAEVYVEDRQSTSGHLDDSQVEEVSTSRSRGAGIRVVSNNSTGYAHTSDLSLGGLLSAAEAAAGAVSSGSAEARVVSLQHRVATATHDVIVDSASVDKASRVRLLEEANAAAREVSSSIVQVGATFAEGQKMVQIANSEGLLTGDRRVRSRFMVNAVARSDAGLQTGSEGPGRSIGFEFYDEFDVRDIAKVAARRAVAMLEARPAPVGQFPVVLKRGAGGVLFHEACGHGLEADLVDRDASVFKGKLGQKIASELVTLVDDGAYSREWGTGSIDDEGTPSQRNVLIQDGVLMDYMYDSKHSRKAGRALSGNGRRQGYEYLPMVRMTNTYLLSRGSTPEEIISSTERGIYCVQLGGGQVNTTTGDFVFGITEAYMIENGEITYPIRAANLIGNGPEVLKLVDAVGNDFDTWAGTCGKDGQGVPVSSGQPTLRVSALTIGGTAGV